MGGAHRREHGSHHPPPRGAVAIGDLDPQRWQRDGPAGAIDESVPRRRVPHSGHQPVTKGLGQSVRVEPSGANPDRTIVVTMNPEVRCVERRKSSGEDERFGAGVRPVNLSDRRSQISRPQRPSPPANRNNSQRRADLPNFVEPEGYLADGHSVSRWESV